MKYINVIFLAIAATTTVQLMSSVEAISGIIEPDERPINHKVDFKRPKFINKRASDSKGHDTAATTTTTTHPPSTTTTKHSSSPTTTKHSSAATSKHPSSKTTTKPPSPDGTTKPTGHKRPHSSTAATTKSPEKAASTSTAAPGDERDPSRRPARSGRHHGKAASNGTSQIELVKNSMDIGLSHMLAGMESFVRGYDKIEGKFEWRDLPIAKHVKEVLLNRFCPVTKMDCVG